MLWGNVGKAHSHLVRLTALAACRSACFLAPVRLSQGAVGRLRLCTLLKVHLYRQLLLEETMSALLASIHIDPARIIDKVESTLASLSIWDAAFALHL